jgi:hypothetical protein
MDKKTRQPDESENPLVFAGKETSATPADPILSLIARTKSRATRGASLLEDGITELELMESRERAENIEVPAVAREAAFLFFNAIHAVDGRMRYGFKIKSDAEAVRAIELMSRFPGLIVTVGNNGNDVRVWLGNPGARSVSSLDGKKYTAFYNTNSCLLLFEAKNRKDEKHDNALMFLNRIREMERFHEICGSNVGESILF